jgi:ribonuclease P protein component
MLPRKNRLSTDKDVTRVLRKGRAVFTNLLVLKALPNDLAVIRLAVVVSTKVHKRAVKRNLIKRRVRAIFQKLIPAIKVPADIAVLAQAEAVGRTQADLQTAIEYCLKNLKLL